jgi:hypothetical protein
MKLLRVKLEYLTDNDEWSEYSTGMLYNVDIERVFTEIKYLLGGKCT